MIETDSTENEQRARTPQERYEYVRRQLVDDVPSPPNISELAVRADALAAAKRLAATNPELVADLVPVVARTVTAVTDVFQSKGRAILPGAYATTILRTGLALIATTVRERCATADAGLVDRASTAASRVLSDDTAHRTARQQALIVLGELAAISPDHVADELGADTATGGSLTPGAVIDRILNRTNDTDRLAELLTAVAILASVDRLGPVTDAVSLATLERCVATGDDRVRAWCHVICRVRNRHSPVDPGELWDSLVEGQVETEEAAVYLVLTQHGAEERPPSRFESRIEVLLRQVPPESVAEVVHLPDTLFDPGQFETEIATATTSTEPTIRVRSTRILLQFVDVTDDMTGRIPEVCAELTDVLEHMEQSLPEDVEAALTDLAQCSATSAHQRAVLDVFVAALAHPDLGLRLHAAETLPALPVERLPADLRTRALDALEAALEADNLLNRLDAVGTLAELAADEAFSAADRDRALTLLEDALTHEDEHVRTWAAHAFADLVVDETLSAARRERAVDGLESVLRDDASPVRTWAAIALADLTTTKAVPEWARSDAIDTLRNSLDSDDPDLRIEAAGALADLAVESGLPDPLTGAAHRTLTSALDDSDPEIRDWAARRLTTLAVEEETSPHRCARVLDILLIAIEADGSQDRDDAERLEQLCSSIESTPAVPPGFDSRVADLLDPSQPAVTRALLAGLSAVPTTPTDDSLKPALQRLLTDGTQTSLQIRALDIRSEFGDTD